VMTNSEPRSSTAGCASDWEMRASAVLTRWVWVRVASAPPAGPPTGARRTARQARTSRVRRGQATSPQTTKGLISRRARGSSHGAAARRLFPQPRRRTRGGAAAGTEGGFSGAASDGAAGTPVRTASGAEQGGTDAMPQGAANHGDGSRDPAPPTDYPAATQGAFTSVEGNSLALLCE